jgi:hypothetical protein
MVVKGMVGIGDRAWPNLRCKARFREQGLNPWLKAGAQGQSFLEH